MDYMDIDEGCNIPDTPDRLAAQNVNGRWCIEKESDSSEVSHSGNTELFREGARNQLRDRSELVLDNGQSETLSFFSGKDLSVPNKSEGEGDFSTSLGNSFSSKNACLFRRTAAEKPANHEDKYSLHSQSTGKGKALSTPQSHTCGEGAVVDLREWSGPAKVFCNDFPNGASEDCQAMEIRDGSISTNGFSSFGGIANSSMTALNTCKGKGKINDTGKGASGLDHGKGTFGDSQPKFGKSTSSLCYSNPSPRVGQNFFVRNGCISPHNIAKAKQLAENHCNGSMDVQNDRVTISDCNLIRDLIAEDSNDNRRQGVIIHPSPREPDAKTIDLATRSSVTPNEETCGTGNASGDAFICFEGSGGWRNTPSCTKKMNLPLSHEGRHLSWTKDDPCYVNQQNENMVVRRESWTGSSSRTDNDYHEDQNTASFQHGSALTEDQVVSRPTSESVHLSGRRSAATTLVKRQKQGSASSNHGESSTLASVHSDIAFLGSSGEPLNSRSTSHQSVHAPRILDPVIEIDESSPEMRLSGSPNTGRSSNDESDDRARQVEADEMLARELQEQLYNEAPGVEDDEWEETSHHAYSSGSHPVFHPSGSSASDFYRQPPLWSSRNHSSRRGTNAQGPASARLTRLRSRLPSQLPRLSRESGSIFPPSMDLDMRMHILEALEDFSDMEMAGNFHQAEREFNENDYEMLLALDENNHQHRGASPTQINSLPQSTVQGDNFEEACAICLETPTSGDTIRHLPCLHKFHKDCIDQWLRMRTSCPVCKSSIT